MQHEGPNLLGLFCKAIVWLNNHHRVKTPCFNPWITQCCWILLTILEASNVHTSLDHVSMMLLQIDTNSQTLPILLLHDHTCPPMSVACAIGSSVNLLPNLNLNWISNEQDCSKFSISHTLGLKIKKLPQCTLLINKPSNGTRSTMRAVWFGRSGYVNRVAKWEGSMEVSVRGKIIKKKKAQRSAAKKGWMWYNVVQC